MEEQERLQFSEVRDANGTSLQSYLQTLADKMVDAGWAGLFVMQHKEHGLFHLASTSPTRVDFRTILKEILDATAPDATAGIQPVVPPKAAE